MFAMQVFGLDMTPGTTTAVVVGAMVLLVAVASVLENRTPAPRVRSTKVVLPRRIAGDPEELPELDLTALHREATLRVAALAVSGTPGSSEEPESAGVAGVSIEAGSRGGGAADAAAGPPTGLVPIVDMRTWLSDRSIEPAAREVLARLRRHRMAPPQPWVPSEFTQEIIDTTVFGAEVEREAAFAAAIGAYDDSSARRGDGVTEPAAAPVADPAAERPTTVFVVRLEEPDSTGLVALGEPGADRDLTGTLFAAYVVGGFPEFSRVTGWVTPRGTPAGLPQVRRGDPLRGRVARIRLLLRLSDDGHGWVTLDQSVHIERGLNRRKPTCGVLKGLLWWWLAVTDERARIPASHVAELADALDAVLPVLEDHPDAPTLRQLRELTATAMANGEGLRITTMAMPALQRAMAAEGAGPSGDDAGPSGDDAGLAIVG